MAVLAALLLLLPTLGQAAPLAASPDAADGTPTDRSVFGPPRHGSGPMRIPDEAAIPLAADLPVVAPAGAHTPLAVPGVALWTVLVYMVADNDLESFAIQDLNEMESSPPSASVNLVVEVDRSLYYDTSNDDWTGTRRYEIARDTDPAAVHSTLIADLGELNMGDPQTLADFLTWGVDAYPADKYLVVLWDHGYGWSGGIGNDLGDGDHLSLFEMGEALRAGADHLGRPFDVLGFDACLMQQVDVVYEVAWAADYVVAAEDLEPAAGWVYDQMLAPLMDTPSIDPDAFAALAVTNYMDYYGTQGDSMMSATSAAELRTGVVNTMNRLAVLLAAQAEPRATMGAGSAAQAIWEARDRSSGLFNADYIDLGDFARRISQDIRVPAEARAAADAVRAAVNATVLEEAHSVYKAGLTGVSVYIPASSVPSQYPRQRFANDSYWDEFLAALIAGIPLTSPAPTLQLTSPPEGAVVGRFFEAQAAAQLPQGGALRIEFKQRGSNWTEVGAGPSPLVFDGTLDAGAPFGMAAVALRAVSDDNVPSDAFERVVFVDPPPVALSPLISELALAVNRTTTVVLTATPRAAFSQFTVEWKGLPAEVDPTGSTITVTASGSPPGPFPITLSLTPNATAAEGSFAVEVRVRVASMPSLMTALPLLIVVSRPLPDLALAPIVLSDDLPLPSQLVTAWTNVSNGGFENASGARVVASHTDGVGATVELANYTVGPMGAGAVLPVQVTFTATPGLQRVNISASLEPVAEELTTANNARERVLNIVNYSVALFPPLLPVEGALGAGPTPVPVGILNAGTQADQYDLSVFGLSNASWQVALPFQTIAVAGRTSQNFSVDVLPPLDAEGGDGLTFHLSAVSRADGSVTASAVLQVVIAEVFNASVRAQPNDLNLSFRGVANVSLTLQNLGNGRESFLLAVQNGDAKLAAALNVSAFSVGPGASASARLSLRDLGLLSTERPYTLEVVAVSQATAMRFTTIVAVHVTPSPTLEVSALEGLVNVSANGSATFHVALRNTGNTNVVASVWAVAAEATLEAAVAVPASLLPPGAFAVLNGTANFTAPALAGNYALTIQALDSRMGASATGQVNLVVAEVHEFTVVVSPAPTAVAGRTVERTITLHNRGNVAETFSLVIGYVQVGVEARLLLDGTTVTVPARTDAAVKVAITGASAAAASGEIPIVVTPSSGAGPVTVSVPYTFAPPAPDPLLGWAFVIGGSTAALAGWVMATGRRPPKKSEVADGTESP